MPASARPLSLALLAWAAIVVTGLAVRPILPIDETRYLSVAWEMWHRGDWLVPHLNGQPYGHKPPLLFWLIGLTWSLFGPGEMVARLVPAAFSLGTLLATVWLARLLWPERAGIAGRAALILAGTALFTLFNGMVLFDLMLAFFCLVAVGCALAGWRSGGRRWWLGFGTALGLAALAKGPVALLFALPPLLLLPALVGPALRPDWRGWYGRLLAGTALAAAIALAWALPAAIAGGADYADMIFRQQTAGRVVDAFAHRRPWWFFLALLPLLLFPWLWWPPLWRGLAEVARRRSADAGTALCLGWLVVVMLVLSLISGKQIHYLVPVLPAVALGIARLSEGQREASPLTLALLVAPVALLAAGAAGVALLRPDLQGLAATAGIPILVGPWIDALAWAPSVVAALALAAAMYYASRWSRSQLAGLAVLAPALLIMLHQTVAPIARPLADFGPFATAVRAHAAGGIAFVREYQGEIGFHARLDAPVATVGWSQLPAWTTAHPAGVVVAPYAEIAGATRVPLAKVYYAGAWLGAWIAAEAPAPLQLGKRTYLAAAAAD